jgi:hypothetical protein
VDVEQLSGYVRHGQKGDDAILVRQVEVVIGYTLEERKGGREDKREGGKEGGRIRGRECLCVFDCGMCVCVCVCVLPRPVSPMCCPATTYTQ